MKQFISLLFITVMCLVTTTTEAKTKDPYHLLVQGEFLSQKHISYTVYKYDVKKDKFVSESRTKARKYFLIHCDRGCKYIVRFQDKKGNTKFLMIDATREGEFVVDVDFRKPYDALLKHTKNGYSLTPLTNSTVKRDYGDLAMN